MKKLTRSQSDKVIAGVLGGFAEYIEVDPTVVRLGYVLITLFSCFAGILFYIIAWIIVPEKVSHETENNKKHSDHESLKEDNSSVSHETEIKKED
jgi:phage shock protein PspC (stress-responsive transcriptional regulator)